MTGIHPSAIDSIEPQAKFGLIVLQPDETIERDMRCLFPASGAAPHVSRVASGAAVTRKALAAMQARLTVAAALLPPQVVFDAVGYGCTSGTAEIGVERIAALLRAGCETEVVTEPVSALVAAARELGVSRLAMLSPYVADVSDRLRDVLHTKGIETPVIGSFDEAEESRVARIDPASICDAGRDLAAQGGVDALFLSCTNLRALEAIAALESDTGLPVLSSNQVLAWHMLKSAGVAPGARIGCLTSRLGASGNAT